MGIKCPKWSAAATLSVHDGLEENLFSGDGFRERLFVPDGGIKENFFSCNRDHTCLHPAG